MTKSVMPISENLPPTNTIAFNVTKHAPTVNVAGAKENGAVDGGLSTTTTKGSRQSDIPRLQASGTYKITEDPVGTIRPARIICVGAGASGINLAYQVQANLKNVTLEIYEKNAGIGGTWYENRYPGCKCDIPSHNYQFSWQPNPGWAEMFSPAHEIRQYLEDCASRHGLHKYFRLNHKVIGATWDDKASIWVVTVEDTINNVIFTTWGHYLINAGGILNNWQWPKIDGLQDFEGKLVHSANWPDNWDFSGLTVAVIGNGSTGIQIVPAIQPHVKKLIHFVRSPTWVTPGAASRYPSLQGENMPERFSEAQKEHFRTDEPSYLAFRKQVEKEINSKFQLLLNGSQRANEIRKMAYENMMQLLGPEGAKYASAVIPDFPVGCRRITPGVGYLETFSKPNVQIKTGHAIERVDKTGIRLATGEHIQVDAIVCATGFDVSFAPRFPIIGRDNISLADIWSEPNIPYAYLSLAIPKMPNYFVFLGPNAPISHGSVFTITEHCSKYVLQCISKAQIERITSFEVKQAACNDFYTHITHFMPRTAWAAKCRSWFKNGLVDGPVLAVHPGSRIHWFHALERPRFEDFDFTYESNNRFQFLGNGMSTREIDGDDTWFLEHPEAEFLYYRAP